METIVSGVFTLCTLCASLIECAFEIFCFATLLLLIINGFAAWNFVTFGETVRARKVTDFILRQWFSFKRYKQLYEWRIRRINQHFHNFFPKLRCWDDERQIGEECVSIWLHQILGANTVNNNNNNNNGKLEQVGKWNSYTTQLNQSSFICNFSGKDFCLADEGEFLQVITPCTQNVPDRVNLIDLFNSLAPERSVGHLKEKMNFAVSYNHLFDDLFVNMVPSTRKYFLRQTVGEWQMGHRNLAFAKDGSGIMLSLFRVKSDTLNNAFSNHVNKPGDADYGFYRESDIIRMVLVVTYPSHLKDAVPRVSITPDTDWIFFHDLVTNTQTQADDCKNPSNSHKDVQNPWQAQLFEMISQRLNERRASARDLLKSTCLTLPAAVSDLTFSYAMPAVSKIFQSSI